MASFISSNELKLLSSIISFQPAGLTLVFLVGQQSTSDKFFQFLFIWNVLISS